MSGFVSIRQDNMHGIPTSHTISIVTRELINHFRHFISLQHLPVSVSFTLYNVTKGKQPRGLMAHIARSFKC